MKKNPNAKLYYGSSELVFSTSGTYGYTILFPSDANSVVLKENPDGITDMRITALGLNSKIYPDSAFVVNPPSILTELDERIGTRVRREDCT